jgi:hypothetical protein
MILLHLLLPFTRPSSILSITGRDQTGYTVYAGFCMFPQSCDLPGVELRFLRHSPDWWVTQNFYSPNRRKTCQNHVFAEHLYSVHFFCTCPTQKNRPSWLCVCVIIINKSPCQICVCISESRRNKTQLAGKKDSLRGGIKHSPSWQVS